MRETADKRLIRGSLRLKLTSMLKLSLIIKSILLVYYLLQYIPCWFMSGSPFMRVVFIYSEGMCANPYYQRILMPV